MAKKSTYKNWDEINFALKYLAETKIKLKKLESEQVEKINEIKKENSLKIEVLQESISKTEKDIELFTKKNIDDFESKRTKKFSFGKISVKKSKNFAINCVKTTLEKLEKLKLKDCIRLKKEIAKEYLKKLDEKTLQKIGVSVITDEKIKIETTL